LEREVGTSIQHKQAGMLKSSALKPFCEGAAVFSFVGESMVTTKSCWRNWRSRTFCALANRHRNRRHPKVNCFLSGFDVLFAGPSSIGEHKRVPWGGAFVPTVLPI